MPRPAHPSVLGEAAGAGLAGLLSSLCWEKVWGAGRGTPSLLQSLSSVSLQTKEARAAQVLGI